MTKTVFLLVFVGLTSCSFLPSSSPLTQTVNSSSANQPSSGVDEDTQGEIIGLILKDISIEDHAVTKDGRVYLSITDSLFKKLPKSINGVKLELLKGIPPDGKLKVAYLTFSGWSIVTDKISVTNIAHFYGGNEGGCNLKFVRVDTRWTEQKRECFASAS